MIKKIFFIAAMAILWKEDSVAQLKITGRSSLDGGWLFHKGDIPFPELKTHDESYMNAKAGKAWAAAATQYDDRLWKKVDLPHDWAIEEGFDSTANLSQAYKTRGIGWYRRYFKLAPSDKGKNIEVQFDGVSTYCTVWVNGNLLWRNWCGYTSFNIDISRVANYGEGLNTIAVRVDGNPMEGWWYEGAGLYRHTWLVKKPAFHINTDGVYANPIKLDKHAWKIPIEVSLTNSGSHRQTAHLSWRLLDKAGREIAQSNGAIAVSSLDTTTLRTALVCKDPHLWSTGDPYLYQLVTTLSGDSSVTQTVRTKCGFRTMTFRADSGFFLNGQRVEIKGVCNHQDHAGVGVAVPDNLWEYRLKKLKDMGANAYRCAHNPPAAEFLDACDSLGILVMDENRNFNISDENVRQLQWMVRRDRNHPSIMLWSIFNEEPMQGSENGFKMVEYLRAVVRKLDTTRAVTAAQSGGQFAPVNVSQAVDVVGFNYQMGAYDRYHKENPQAKMMSSEDVSALMQRDVYVTDKKKNSLDAYDDQKPAWGSTHRLAWKTIVQRPFLAGCFVWTGFDYKGEPTPYKWPTVGSSFGTMDQCGFPKTAFWIHQAQWRPDMTILKIVPHWNWPKDSIGKKIRVMVISNVDSIVLKHNDQLIGGQKADIFEMNTWQVAYKPGKLQALGYKNGKLMATSTVETSGAPYQIKISADRPAVNNDGLDAIPVTISVLDREGRYVPDAINKIRFDITGSGEIIGLGNGDPNSHEPDKGSERSLFNGLAQVILQSKQGGQTPITLTASSLGLQPSKIVIGVKPVPPPATEPAAEPVVTISQWRMNISSSYPDPMAKITDNDMNTWISVGTGQTLKLSEKNYAAFRANIIPYSSQASSGGKLVMKKVSGVMGVYLNGRLITTKNSKITEDMDIDLPAITGEAELFLIFKGEPDHPSGLGGPVTLVSKIH